MRPYQISEFQKKQFIHSSLYLNHNINSSHYNNIQISNLINNKLNHMTVNSKEQGIDDYFEEYFKRYYQWHESFARLPQIAEYYKHYLIIFGIPTFSDLSFNSNVHLYATKKAEIYYNNHCLNEEKILESLESNSNILNHHKESQKHFLTETIRENIENTDQSSNSLVFNGNDVYEDKAKIMSFRSKEDESLLSILLMINPVTGVLKDKIKKLSNTLNASGNNVVSTVDKTKTVKDDNNANDTNANNEKSQKKKSRNRNINSCGLLNTMAVNNEFQEDKTKSKNKFLSFTNNLNDFKTFFQLINKTKVQQLLNQINNNKPLKEKIDNKLLESKRKAHYNSPVKSRSNSKKKNKHTKDSNLCLYQPVFSGFNEYTTSKVKSHSRNNGSSQQFNNQHQKSYFSLTIKNIPVYKTNNERQSTQENVQENNTIHDSGKTKKYKLEKKQVFNKINMTSKVVNYSRQSKTRPKLKDSQYDKEKDNTIKSSSQVKDNGVFRGKTSQEYLHTHTLINSYYGKIDKGSIKLPSKSKEIRPIRYLNTQQDDNHNLSKATVKIQMNRNTSSKPKINREISLEAKKLTHNTNIASSISKKKNKTLTIDLFKNYGIANVLSRLNYKK